MRITALLLACCYQAGHPGPTADGAPSDTLGIAAASRTLSIMDPAISTPVDNVPIYVGIDDTVVDYSMIPDISSGLAFHDSNGHAVPFEVAAWNPGGKSDVWILTSLSPSGPTQITMSYGTGLGPASPTDVWAQYQLVAHLDDTSDASAHRAGTLTGGATFSGVPGIVGGAVHYDGATDEALLFDTSLFDGWQDFTLSFWIYLDYPSPGAVPAIQPAVIDQTGSAMSSELVYNGSSGTLSIVVDPAFGTSAPAQQIPMAATVPVNSWVRIACTYDHVQDNAHLVVDGKAQPAAVQTGGKPLIANATPFVLGSTTGSIPAITGEIDELWAGSNASSDDALIATYDSVTGSIISFGP